MRGLVRDTQHTCKMRKIHLENRRKIVQRSRRIHHWIMGEFNVAGFARGRCVLVQENPHFFQNEQRNYLCLEYWYWRCFRVCTTREHIAFGVELDSKLNVLKGEHAEWWDTHFFVPYSIFIENGRITSTSVVSLLCIRIAGADVPIDFRKTYIHSFIKQRDAPRNIELRFIYTAFVLNASSASTGPAAQV